MDEDDGVVEWPDFLPEEVDEIGEWLDFLPEELRASGLEVFTHLVFMGGDEIDAFLRSLRNMRSFNESPLIASILDKARQVLEARTNQPALPIAVG